MLDESSLSEIGVWEEAGQIVAVAHYESTLGEAFLDLAAHDASMKGGEWWPCRFTVVDQTGALAALHPATADTNSVSAALRPGVVYARTGRVRVGVLPGVYTVYASRGFEYSVVTQTMTVAAGQTVAKFLGLRREVPAHGWVAADTHIHTLTHSKHGDATLDERMLTIAGEGIELAVATAIGLFGFNSGAALATVVGVLIEVPVMLTVVHIVNRSKGWYERGRAADR